MKKLWKLCFDDSEAFTELYFRLRYNDDVNVAIYDGEEVISALQMLPYPMTFCGSKIATSYISGACTHPACRGKGIMKELLLQSFVRMQQKNIPVSTLIPAEPWLFGYYARMGYAPVFNYTERRIKPEPNPAAGIEVKQSVAFEEDSYTYLNQKMHQRLCCLQHTRTDYEVILEDIKQAGGTVLTAYKGCRVVGITLATPQKIHELFADSTAVENELIRTTASCFGTGEITVITPPEGKHGEETQPLGMLRIIDAETVLKLYAAAHPDSKMKIELTDRQLPVNNGRYCLENGMCLKKDTQSSGGYMKLDISELASMLFLPLRPYMSLMLN